MRKQAILSGLLVGTLMMSLCACGNDVTPSSTPSTTKTATTTVGSVTESESGATTTTASDAVTTTAADSSPVSGTTTITTRTPSTSATKPPKTTIQTTTTTKAPTATTAAKPTLPSGVKAVITLGNTPSVLGSGVSVSGKTVTITAPGTYRLEGQLTDGQIVVNDTAKAENIILQLNGVTVTNKAAAPIYVQNAEKVIFTTLKGSVNTITDNRTALDSDNAACIYADDDITFNGEGKLIVNGHYNNGIRTKNDLKITAGTLEVTAAKNGIRGNGSVEIKGGTVRITCDKDGIKSSETTDVNKGFILVSGGNITVTAGDDAMQAPRRITVSGGECRLSAEGKLYKCEVPGGVDIKAGCVTEVK